MVLFRSNNDFFTAYCVLTNFGEYLWLCYKSRQCFWCIFPSVFVQVFKRVNVCEKRKTKSIFYWPGWPSFGSWLPTNCPSLEMQTIFSKIFEGYLNGASENVLKTICEQRFFLLFAPCVYTHTNRGKLCISQTFPFKRAQSLCTVLLALLNVESWYKKKQRTLLLKPSSDFWVNIASYINLSTYYQCIMVESILCKTRNPSASVHDPLTSRFSGKQNNSSWTGPARIA